jgi:DNA polymerase-3 subunit beta
MRFRLERDVLAEAVAWAARSLPTRPPVPVLAGLLLELADSELTLSSFDYEVSARVRVPVDGGEEGQALVSGRLLSEIARSLPSRPVEFVADAGKVSVTGGSARFVLPTLPVEDYPPLPDMPGAAGTVPSDVFAAAVGQVAIAAGRDDTLPVLTGVRLEIEGESVTLAATDRYRLAVRELTWKPEQPDAATVALVPARTLAESARALTAGDMVTLALSSGGHGEGLIGFESAGRRITSRLLDGEFPKYRSLLPHEYAAVADVETASFVEALRRVALVAERNTPVRLNFTADGCELAAGAGEDAQAAETVDADFEGEDMAIAFNPTYLLDGLGALGTAQAKLSFTTPIRPAVLTAGRASDGDGDGDPGSGGSDGGYRYLLMPVRLSG